MSNRWTAQDLADYQSRGVRTSSRVKRLKYGNTKTVVNGIRFDSKKESRRYHELVLLQRNGEISNLELQPKYEFKINGVRIGTYRPDFRYRTQDGDLVVEDCKSEASKTTAYRLRKKMMFAFHGLTVLET